MPRKQRKQTQNDSETPLEQRLHKIAERNRDKTEALKKLLNAFKKNKYKLSVLVICFVN